MTLEEDKNNYQQIFSVGINFIREVDNQDKDNIKMAVTSSIIFLILRRIFVFTKKKN